MKEMKKQKGFSLIELLIVIVIIGVISAIAVPNLLASRRAANEASAIASIKTITASQATYATYVGGGNFGNLDQLSTRGLIDSNLGCATAPCGKSGYAFSVSATAATTTAVARYETIATPKSFGTGWGGSGSRSFYSNESGVLYFAISATAPLDNGPGNRVPTGGSVLQ